MLFRDTTICGGSLKKSKEMIIIKVIIVVTSKENVIEQRQMGGV